MPVNVEDERHLKKKVLNLKIGYQILLQNYTEN